MPETKEHQKQRHKHHMTIGGVTHGVHHGVLHGEHGVTASRNMHQNRVKANPHAGGAHGWVYTTKKGDTLQSLQNRAWSRSTHSNLGKNIAPTSNTDITRYANNAALLKSQGVKKYPGFGGNYYHVNQLLRPGTRIVL